MNRITSHRRKLPGNLRIEATLRFKPGLGKNKDGRWRIVSANAFGLVGTPSLTADEVAGGTAITEWYAKKLKCPCHLLTSQTRVTDSDKHGVPTSRSLSSQLFLFASPN